MTTDTKASKDGKSKDDKQQNGVSEEERKRESSKAAQKAMSLQRQADDLTKAAAGAGDPEERQRLLNEALEKQVEAGSFGKTAKYLSSGTFQGMGAGGGIGAGSGVGLGVLTGTLVGGVTSLTLGGLGTGLGALVGAIHGPWFKPGQVAGNALTKVTGTQNLGWDATDEQKKSLEKMIGQVHKQEAPGPEELEAMSKKANAYAGEPTLDPDTAHDTRIVDNQKRTVTDNIPGSKYIPGMSTSDAAPPTAPKDKDKDKPKTQDRESGNKDSKANEKKKPASGSSGDGNSNPSDKNSDARPNDEAPKTQTSTRTTSDSTKPHHSVNGAQAHSDSRPIDAANGKFQSKGANDASQPANEPRKKPRKLQSRSQTPGVTNDESRAKSSGSSSAKKPPKLESKSRRTSTVDNDAVSQQSNKPRNKPRKLAVGSQRTAVHA